MKIPRAFQEWFQTRGWKAHPHQLELLANAANTSNLLIAPTGCGKTLAGFLPSLIELKSGEHKGMHTLYVSPLKALAADIKRNLQTPVDDMELSIRIEDRTGDTSNSKRKRQRVDPPQILLTTPESLALLLSYEDSDHTFKGLQCVIVDEAHALAESKRGDQLMLSLARLQKMHPDLRRISLSATVDDPTALAKYVSPRNVDCKVLTADAGLAPDISMLKTDTPPPWSGAGATYAIPNVFEEIKRAKTTLIFINTRAQAEIFFHALWQANVDNLPIGLHHGSLSKDARDKVENAMIKGQLRAIVCTGTLDLGIDWGDVDLVIQVGAPKNIKRLVQRIGRANHRYNTPSKAVIVPSNRFEVIECQAALQAAQENDLDGEPRGSGPLDVLCQHILICACHGPFCADQLYKEIKSAGPYFDLLLEDFHDCLDFCATGGYAFRKYDRWQKLMQLPNGLWCLRDPRATQRIRMNIGTIVDTETLKVRLKNRLGGAPLGEVEEAFASTLTAGETFLIGGQVVRYEGLREMIVQVTKAATKRPKIAVFSGTKFATSTLLSQRVIELLNSTNHSSLPKHTQDWLALQSQISKMPQANRMLVESFKRKDMHYTCFYGFAGRNALQTLGLLLTRRMEHAGLEPLGMTCTDYALLVWGLQPITMPSSLLSMDGIENGFQEWLEDNAVMKRSFRTVATIAGLIEKNLPSQRKSGRQATFSSDILYDTLRKYEPNHLMMRITKDEAMQGLIDFDRIKEMLGRTKGRVDHVQAPHVTPLAAPLLLEVGRIRIKGSAEERLIDEEADRLMKEALLKNLA